MKPWFGRRPATVRGADQAEAYREGRADERRDEGPWARRSAPVRVRRRGGLGLVGLVFLIIVAVGAIMLYLAARNGSFSAGGAVVDHGLSNAAHRATAPVRHAEDKAGQALENAGRSLQRNAGPDDGARAPDSPSSR